MTDRSKTVVLLIDWDNLEICHKRDAPGTDVDLNAVIALAQSYGTLVSARAYAEWNNAAERMMVYKSGIEPVFAPVMETPDRDRRGSDSGFIRKSLADTVMVADGMDLLWTVAPDVMVLVTSDKDMIPLARIAKQRGAAVVILGSDLTAIPLVEISNVFITYRQLLRELDRTTELNAPAGRAPARERRSVRETRRPSSEIGAARIGHAERPSPRVALAAPPPPAAATPAAPAAPPPAAEPAPAAVATSPEAADSTTVIGPDGAPRRRRRRGGRSRGRGTGTGLDGADTLVDTSEEPAAEDAGAAATEVSGLDTGEEVAVPVAAAEPTPAPKPVRSSPTRRTPLAARSAPSFSDFGVPTPPAAPAASSPPEGPIAVSSPPEPAVALPNASTSDREESSTVEAVGQPTAGPPPGGDITAESAPADPPSTEAAVDETPPVRPVRRRRTRAAVAESKAG